MHIEMHVILSTLCLTLASGVIANAYYQKKQFYPAIVHITKSNASMAVIYVQFFVIVFMFGKLLRKIFLGTLRAAEFERLLEKFWYALTETCLAFTVFRDDFNPRFVALFTVLLFLKSFHWLSEERIDFMERSPLLGWLFHLRVASLLFVLGLLDYLLLMHAYNSTIEKGPTVQLVFGFEYAILLTILTNSAIKFGLHAAEMRTDSPWENKAVFLLYIELVIGLIKVILYVFFVIIMAKIYALPMFVFRPMFFTIRNFKKVLSDVILSRRAIRNMNHLYPEATFEELRTSDNICIICREDMVSNAKKLPCGHIFHTVCLRSWFQRQQTCPTCRLNILRTNNSNTNTQRPVIPINTSQMRNNNEQNLGTDTNNTNSISVKKIIYNSGKLSETNAPFMLTPSFTINPQCMSPPKIPPSLFVLSDEELRLLEGNERKSVERRIQHLQNIQLMLDASTMLMHQYILASDHMKSTEKNTPPPATAAAPPPPPPAAAAAAAATTTTTHKSPDAKENNDPELPQNFNDTEVKKEDVIKTSEEISSQGN